MQAMYSSLITIVAIMLFIITVLIVLLILYVIMRSMTSSLKTDFGIYKAMGFTSRQSRQYHACRTDRLSPVGDAGDSLPAGYV
ncbi:MAG: hypothetical protein IJ555_06245 [Ruminococcus sp.]|nr:hypothetical protein [Ruminococcus sp.]